MYFSHDYPVPLRSSNAKENYKKVHKKGNMDCGALPDGSCFARQCLVGRTLARLWLAVSLAG